MSTGPAGKYDGIRAENLCKHFPRSAGELSEGRSGFRLLGRRRGEPVRAVDDVSLEVAPGTVLGLLGRNGAGKTTFVKLLATLIEPTQGDAWVSGFSIRSEGPRVRGSLALAAGTERGFYFRLTGAQNLSFFGALYGIPPRLVAERSAAALDRLELAEAAHRPFMRYSSGMRRKLDLARALILDPPVLLLDEPTASLDPNSADRIRAVIAEERRRGKTVVLVTHNLLEAERLCDRVAILDSGRLRAMGALQELRRGRAGRTVELTTTGDDRSVDRLVAALGELPGTRGVVRDASGIRIFLADHEALMPVLATLAASEAGITGVSARDLTLEEIFREITGAGDTVPMSVGTGERNGGAARSAEERPL